MPKNFNITAEAPEEVTNLIWHWVLTNVWSPEPNTQLDEHGIVSDESYVVTIFSQEHQRAILAENASERNLYPNEDHSYMPPDEKWIPVFHLSDDQTFGGFSDTFYITQDARCVCAEGNWGVPYEDTPENMPPQTLEAALRSVKEILDEPPATNS